ncbi:MAG: SGNH/GDSL hydrolase family protein [Marmoricola sp.]
MTRRSWRGVLAVAMAIGVGLVASACGSSAPSGPKAGPDYVALGDSYTAFPGTSSTINALCSRSSTNYPHQLAAALHYTLTDVSCSGAKTKDLTGSQKAGVAPQFDALSKSTKLVTISIGANNDLISSVLFLNCRYVIAQNPTGQPCRNATASWAATAFTQLEPQLVAAYQAIKTRAPNARVLVVGYPQILGNSGTCAKYAIATGDVAYIDELNTKLNDAVRTAAKAAGVQYVDLSQLSMSHGICSASPWINGATTMPGVALAMHPFAAEQQAVAALLEKKLKG